MINVKFFTGHNRIYGFEVKGHSGLGERGHDILCATVSSSAYMTVNTLTDVLHVDVKTDISDGYMKVYVKELTDGAENILKGFQIHITALAKDYRKNLKVIYGGAENA